MWAHLTCGCTNAWSDTARTACSIGEAVVYAGAAVAEIAAGNLAYATTHYGVSWCAPGPARPQLELPWDGSRH